EGLQGFYVEDLCQPVYEAWLEMASLTYLKTLPGGDWKVYNQAEWHPRSFPWIDPLKDTEALVAKWSNKITTLNRILASEGYDFEETIQEWADEQKRAKELGVDLMPITATPNQVLTGSDKNQPDSGKPGKADP